MKKLILLILTFFCFQACDAVTLEGSVEYTVEKARKEAFANVEYTIAQEIIDKNLKDPNFKANKKAMKNGVKDLGDRRVTPYSSGNYGIIYKNNLYIEYTYNSAGVLEKIGRRTGLNCPVKCYRYNIQNELTEITLYATLKDVYTFNAKGKLIAHWIGDICYDNDGNIIHEILN